MKLNKIWMVLAATAIVGCTSDDLGDFAAKQAPEDSRMIQLDENFMLAGVGVDNATTRTHWEMKDKALKNKFLPIYNAPAKNENLADVVYLEGENAEAVGLCWLGETAGANVYTNYQFYHFGWLNNDEAGADLDKCGVLYNGCLYSDIDPLAAASTGDDGDEANPAVDFDGAIPAKSLKAGVDNLNYNSGVYQTQNKTIFGGQYIVYYPYDEDFQEVGTIPAKAETIFNPASTEFTTAELGKATFRYSAPVTIEGGMNAADFGLYNLSALVQLKVSVPKGDDALGDFVDQIILYSPSKKLLKQANLAADKIAASLEGEALYASTEGTKTITATFDAGEEVELKVAKDAAKGAFITVLPTTVDDLKVLVHNQTDGTWATIDMGDEENPVKFEAGSAKLLNIIVSDDDFEASFTAVDQTSLEAALTEANAVAAEDNPVSIQVIGDITLENNLSINPGSYTECKWITVKGDDIIVPEEVILTLGQTTMESTVRVLGKSCCTPAANDGGRLIIEDETVINSVTMVPTEARVTADNYDKFNPMVTFDGTATVAEDAVFDVLAGKVVVNAAVQHKGAMNISAFKDKDDVLLGAKVTVSGTGGLKFMGNKAIVDNSGIIEVEAAGKFDITDVNGNSTWREGQRMTNNPTGKFIHNVDAGVGTAVQYMNQNGEYRCKVTDQVKLDNAFKQWTACNVIEIIAAGNYDLGTGESIATSTTAKTAPFKHNNTYIDFEINAGGVVNFLNPGTSNGDNKTINIGNLTVTDGGLEINYINGTANDKLGKRTLNVYGNMLVKADTDINSSEKVNIAGKDADGVGNGEGDLTIEGVELYYQGGKYENGAYKPNFWYNRLGLAVTGDITVSGAAGEFNAGDDDALNITCANFYLTDGATAEFGNQSSGGDKAMTVSGTISNPKDCTFDIYAAAGGVIAWITCTNLEVGGTFPHSEPLNVAE